MANYKENYISLEEYKWYQQIGLTYEGFITGVGYAYTRNIAIAPAHMGRHNPPRFVPPGMDRYIQGRVQYIDTSDEAIELSLKGNPEIEKDDKVEEVQAQGGDVIYSGLPEGDWEIIGINNIVWDPNTTKTTVIQIGLGGVAAAGHGVVGEAGIVFESYSNPYYYIPPKGSFYTVLGWAIGYDYGVGPNLTINTSNDPNFNMHSINGWGGSFNGGLTIVDFGAGENARPIVNPIPKIVSGNMGISIGAPVGGSFQWAKTKVY